MTTAKRALVVGSQTGGLTGVLRDAELMAAALTERGFEVQRCTGSRATRAGIIAAYERLIADSKAGDAAVFYYSGHGAVARNRDYEPRRGSPASPDFFQFIVPYDYADSTDADFRGITSYELAWLLTRLTRQAKNVTLIFDCCHSARICRNHQAVPRALPKPQAIGVDAHLATLFARGASWAPEGNPHALRVMAAGTMQSAYEYVTAQGECRGVLTESLLLALGDAGQTPITWEMIARQARERVLQLFPQQRPEFEGPVGRLLFELEVPPRTRALAVAADKQGYYLRGGRVVGVCEDDEFGIMPPHASKFDPRSQLASAIVTEVSGIQARLRFEGGAPPAPLPEGASAFPVRVAAPKRLVLIDAAPAEREELARAIDGCSLLEAQAVGLAPDSPDAATDEPGRPALATVRVVPEPAGQGPRLEIRDWAGALAVEPVAYGESALPALVEGLRAMAASQSLRALQGRGSPELRPETVTFEWGLVREGVGTPLPTSGEIITCGDTVYFKVKNLGQRPCYVSIFDIGVGYEISLLSRGSPSGIVLAPGADYVLGHREGRGLKGLRLVWAQGVPQDEAREEEVLALVTSWPEDLRVLETSGVHGADGDNDVEHVAHPRAADGRKTRAADGRQTHGDDRGSPLAARVAQLKQGNRRKIMPEDIEDDFVIKRISFKLSPRALPTPALTRAPDPSVVG